jgi:YHS domain-containing protein
MRSLPVLILLAGLTATHASTHDNVDRNHLAVQGYDVVAYFTRGTTVKGDKSITAEHDGHVYRFASAEHRDLFRELPQKYVPAYGGWCATAVALKGTKVDIDPASFKIVGDRLMLFYKGIRGDALREWNRHDEDELVRKAEDNWRRMTAVAE